ncbi:MAG: phosphopentomutase [Anaerovoracaceae bacterium]|jgi:phosphopentomutase
MIKRAVIIVTDSLGIGALPDAARFGDEGADTLGHILDRVPGLNIPNLRRLGFGNIEGAAGGRLKVGSPQGAFGRCREESAGKDTITGHWEIAGIYTEKPFRTYPDGFPEEFIKQFEGEIGTEVLGNYPESGTVIIDKLGPEHERTGKPIVYTSADSVFQIAANTDVIPLERLYEICLTARRLLRGEWACGRVIARPYIIKDGKRVRTADRRDYAVSPPEETLLDRIKNAGKTVCAVGKIHDIFNGKGITESIHTVSNMDGVDRTLEAMRKDFSGLIFTNLVEFDSLYGHRRDPEGYAKAIEEFDARIPEIEAAAGDTDAIFICSDHGNDPVHSGFDHTREYIPVTVFGKEIRPGADIGTRHSYADIGSTVADMLGTEPTPEGVSFRSEIIK